jgi:pyruvate/2-oxoglutarate dehydrogenase complex dihydrolipoamide acyltransferase (E2) component
MEIPVIMPDLGVPRATLSLWFVEESSNVHEGERLAEILAGAATFDVCAPAAGQLMQRCTLPADPVLPGQVLGYIFCD